MLWRMEFYNHSVSIIVGAGSIDGIYIILHGYDGMGKKSTARDIMKLPVITAKEDMLVTGVICEIDRIYGKFVMS